jgi:single stranded DNA-binding protein
MKGKVIKMANKCLIVGYVTGDIVKKDISTANNSNLKVANFNIATGGKTVKDQNGNYSTVEGTTVFVKVNVFGTLAQNVNMAKGTKVGVEGNLQMNKYKNKEGVDVNSLEITANSISVYVSVKAQSTTAPTTTQPNNAQEIQNKQVPDGWQ